MIAMGSIVGFTAGIYNPFNVGVAQSIAGVTPCSPEPGIAGLSWWRLLL